MRLGIFTKRRVRLVSGVRKSRKTSRNEQGALDVKTSFFSAAVVATLLVIVGAASLPAQNRPAAPAGQGVAVIDVGAVFKGHKRFEQMMEKLKTDVQAADQSFKAETDKVNKSIKQLQEYKAGSPEYKKLEEQVTHQQADIGSRASLQKKAFMEREAKIYYAIYQEIQDEVKYYAEAKGVGMVVRHNSEPIDPNSRNSVMAGINKTVVFQQPGLDITNVILNELNRRGNAGGAGTPVANPKAGRPKLN
jgi:Skp family chaperone for outer membrane proteins